MTTCDTAFRNCLPYAIALSALLLSPIVHAQAEDQAAARALFIEGRALMSNGKYTDACPKLEAASTLYRSAGIVLNYADCLEKEGKTASAWTEFGDAASIAERTNRESDAAEAQKRQAALEPKLSRLTIVVSSPIAGLSIKRDGTVLSSAAWAAAIPIDPGTHEIHAEAPGRQPWTTTVTISVPGQTVPVNVPELAPLAAAPVAAAPVAAPVSGAPVAAAPPSTDSPAADSAPGKERSTALDWALIAGGGALAVGGVVLMAVESGRASDSRKQNDPAEFQSAKAPWAIGLTVAAVGGVAAITGAVLLAMTPQSSTAAVRPYPWVATNGGGLDIGGTW